VAFALVGANDQAHLRRFLLTLKYRGFLPRVVISGGSNLHPAVLAEVWPTAAHQPCVFHVLQGVTEKALDAVRRLRRARQRRGKAGRKRKRGRPSEGARKKRRASEGPTNRGKAAFVFRRRHLIVKRQEGLSGQGRADLEVTFAHLPGLRVLWPFSQEIYEVWQTEQGRKVARWRWGRLKNNEGYREVPGRVEVLGWLDGRGWARHGRTAGSRWLRGRGRTTAWSG
jgi:hypothetical protein